MKESHQGYRRFTLAEVIAMFLFRGTVASDARSVVIFKGLLQKGLTERAGTRLWYWERYGATCSEDRAENELYRVCRVFDFRQCPVVIQMNPLHGTQPDSQMVYCRDVVHTRLPERVLPPGVFHKTWPEIYAACPDQLHVSAHLVRSQCLADLFAGKHVLTC